MEFPKDSNLPTHLLASCFDSTSATYKYYWFLSILDCLNGGIRIIEKRELFARMVAIPWYTVNYFQVSFGKQDVIHRAVENIKRIENISIEEHKNVIVEKLVQSQNQETQKTLNHFNNQVPHWFLAPWLKGEKLISRIYSRSQGFENDCLYALYPNHVEINSNWIPYLIQNIRFLRDFCFWNLAIFLQKRNPGLPDVPSKLIKPPSRIPLTNQRKNFWNLFFDEVGTMKCIYTGENLNKSNYVVEHFIPHRYVCHDLIWNLVPADSTFNSTKSDKIPVLEDFFDDFYEIHRKAIEIVSVKDPKSNYLFEYLDIFQGVQDIKKLSESFEKEKFRKTFNPMVLMAINNGFQSLAKS
ncbi:HNH endonuclease domain-containing protein [Cecembia rubra]|uniref:HNH endonuclease n=1 Tax=Cecembia rubra TaxID=1485585 RepID=A0A2P8E1V1_9BACT|nr:HNH endonuclease domain-containing protein [Cecembia rubra]PSL03451.1 HNH endonuclease [Cecembia rubra]